MQPTIRQFHLSLGSGLTPIRSTLTIYGIEKTASTLLAKETVSGNMIELTLSDVAAYDYFYAVAELEQVQFLGVDFDRPTHLVQLLSVFDKTAPIITLSEPATIANLFCFSRLITVRQNAVQLFADSRTLAVAYGMKNNFCATSGTISPVIQSSPNGLESNSYPLYNFLSNLLYYCIADQQVATAFADIIQAELSLDERTPLSNLAAWWYLSRNPFTDVEGIYNLASHRDQIYQPALPDLPLPPTPVLDFLQAQDELEGSAKTVAFRALRSRQFHQPTQWTLSFKVNQSGSQNFLFGGPAFVVFDKEDKAWISNNVRQGTPNSSTFAVVLNSDGSPADISPVFGGGLLGSGFGIATNKAKDTVYIGNYGWGPKQCNPQQGSVSVFGHKGDVQSPVDGYVDKLSRVQGMCFDDDNNLWMASWGTQEPMAPSDFSYYHFEDQRSAIVVYPDGKPDNAISYAFDSPYDRTFDVVIDSEGHAIVANSGDKAYGVPSSVHKFKLVNGNIERIASWDGFQDPTNAENGGFEGFRQVMVNKDDEIYVCGITTDRIVKLNKDLTYQREFTTNISAPWGVNIDEDGVIYVANFGREHRKKAHRAEPLRLGVLGVTVIDEQKETYNLIRLSTGGDEVLLPNGFPLYGNPTIDGKQDVPFPCYQPLMRLTSTNIDRAGNLWALNNWKPSARLDLKENPGGDGVVIFVGSAAPGGRGEEQ